MPVSHTLSAMYSNKTLKKELCSGTVTVSGARLLFLCSPTGAISSRAVICPVLSHCHMRKGRLEQFAFQKSRKCWKSFYNSTCPLLGKQEARKGF